MTTQLRQGWNADPFGRFEQRYFSDGTPTTLVRTGHIETRDDPARPAPTPMPARRDPAPETASIAARFRVYERRPHPVLGRLSLTIAFLTPVVGWELLVSGSRDRLLGAAVFVVLAATLTGIVRISRAARFSALGRDEEGPRRPHRELSTRT